MRRRLPVGGGGGPLVSSFEGLPYGSLELQYDNGEHLVRVNASLVH